MGTAIEHPVSDRVKPSFVIFDIRTLWHSALTVIVPGCQNYIWRHNPVWHRMLYSCTHIATVGSKGSNLKFSTCGRVRFLTKLFFIAQTKTDRTVVTVVYIQFVCK